MYLFLFVVFFFFNEWFGGCDYLCDVAFKLVMYAIFHRDDNYHNIKDH